MGIIRWLKTSLSPHPQERRTDETPYQAPLNARSNMQGQAMGSRHGKTGREPGYAAKRRYERFSIEDGELKAKAALTEVIELSNVSIGGACIITTGTLSPGDNVLLKIPSEKVEKPLKCTIIWETASDKRLERDGANVPAYKAGVRFNDVAPGTVVRLKDFMRSAGVPEERSHDEVYNPSPLRYSVLLNEKTFMNYAATFPVKKISLGGMLVEAGPGLQLGGKYRAALYLPGSDSGIRFNGRVASKIPAAGGFDAGIEFCDMTEDDRRRLSAFLDMLAMSH
jgi:PilZ domain